MSLTYPAIAVIYTTDSGSESGSDESAYVTVYDSDNKHERFSLSLTNYDMRVAGRTDTCVFELQKIGSDVSKIVLESDGGWTIRSLWVVLLGSDNDKQLLVAIPDKKIKLSSSQNGEWKVPHQEAPKDGDSRLWLLHRTADVGNADTDSQLHLCVETSAGSYRTLLSGLEHNERERLRSDQYEIVDKKLSKLLRALQPGDVILENRKTDAWVPDYIFLFGWDSSWGAIRLLGCPDPWIQTWEHASSFARDGCSAHSINWIGGDRLLAGPGLTCGTETSVVVWMWVNRYKSDDTVYSLSFLLLDEDGELAASNSLTSQRRENSSANQTPYGLFLEFEVSGFPVKPREQHRFRMTLFDASIDLEFQAPPASDSGSVSIVFSSCADMSRSENRAEAYRSMATGYKGGGEDLPPHLAILGGDNGYFVSGIHTEKDQETDAADWIDEESRTRRFLDTRTRPELQRLMRTAPVYATWDDHDFGFNNAYGGEGGNQQDPKVAARTFRRTWPGAYVKTGVEDPLYGSFKYGPVEVFITDGRYYRSSSVIWGGKQTTWLEGKLKASAAAVWVVVVSTQFLNNRGRSSAHRAECESEWSDLLTLMNDNLGDNPKRKILILSGDVHWSELMVLESTSKWKNLIDASHSVKRYGAMEMTSSPVQLRKDGNYDSPEASDEEGPSLIFLQKTGYANILIDVSDGASNITMRFQDPEGKELAEGLWDSQNYCTLTIGGKLVV